MICAVQVCLGGVSLNKEKEMKKAVFLAVLAFATTSVFGEMDDAEVSEGSQNERSVGKVSKRKNSRFKNKNLTSRSTKGKSGKKADIYKDFPLHKAVSEGNEEWIRKNIEEYDLDGKSNNGNTPLMVAAIRGNVNIAKILIDNGANIEIKSDKGTPVLIFAALYNRFEMVRYLIEVVKVNPNVVDAYEFTALMTAARKGYEDIVKYLLQNQDVLDDIDHKSKKGNTAYSLAKIHKNAKIMKLLENAGADVNVTVSSSAKRKRSKVSEDEIDANNSTSSSTRSEVSEDETDANNSSSNSKKRKRSSKNKSKSRKRKK